MRIKDMRVEVASLWHAYYGLYNAFPICLDSW